MAAITPFLERPEDAPDDAKPTAELLQLAGLGDYGASDAGPQELIGKNSATLHRFVWTRQLLEDHLRKTRWWMERGGRGFIFKITDPIPHDVLPWRRMSPGARGDTFELWSEGNRKMNCPSWDLPAGSTFIGGTCPGATMGQPVVPPQIRVRAGLVPVPDVGYVLQTPAPGGQTIPFREHLAICLYCYAGEGSYGYAEIQTAEILRYWWSAALCSSEAGRREWVEIMAESLLALPHRLSQGIKPVRVHSSGDFFDLNYARAWMELANRVYEAGEQRIVFWAPTRSWAVPGWSEKWQELARVLKYGNFVLRASAYHTGDPAPDEIAPGLGRGTTSLFHDDIVAHGPAGRYEWDCPVYAFREKKRKSGSEDGKKESVNCDTTGCRKCWRNPELRVNYTNH